MTALTQGLLPFLARVLICIEFAIGANGKITGWQGQAAYMAAHRMPMIPVLLGAALAVEVLGTLCVVVGFHARAAALALFVYLGIVSVTLHDFWTMSGGAAGANQVHFFKNLGMMGGLLLIACYGPGRWAARREG